MRQLSAFTAKQLAFISLAKFPFNRSPFDSKSARLISKHKIKCILGSSKQDEICFHSPKYVQIFSLCELALVRHDMTSHLWSIVLLTMALDQWTCYCKKKNLTWQIQRSVQQVTMLHKQSFAVEDNEMSLTKLTHFIFQNHRKLTGRVYIKSPTKIF